MRRFTVFIAAVCVFSAKSLRSLAHRIEQFGPVPEPRPANPDSHVYSTTQFSIQRARRVRPHRMVMYRDGWGRRIDTLQVLAIVGIFVLIGLVKTLDHWAQGVR